MPWRKLGAACAAVSIVAVAILLYAVKNRDVSSASSPGDEVTAGQTRAAAAVASYPAELGWRRVEQPRTVDGTPQPEILTLAVWIKVPKDIERLSGELSIVRADGGVLHSEKLDYKPENVNRLKGTLYEINVAYDDSNPQHQILRDAIDIEPVFSAEATELTGRTD